MVNVNDSLCPCIVKLSGCCIAFLTKIESNWNTMQSVTIVCGYISINCRYDVLCIHPKLEQNQGNIGYACQYAERLW